MIHTTDSQAASGRFPDAALPDAPPLIGELATAGQDFDWTRRQDAPTRSLLTTWLEVGQRVICGFSIVPERTRTFR